MDKNKQDFDNKQRQEWIALLAKADPFLLKKAEKQLGKGIEYAYITKPETGMIMVRARADNKKSGFCLGEISVTKCILKIEKKIMGYAMVMGSDHDHAKNAALFDGLLQIPEYSSKLMQTLIPELKKISRNEKKKQAKQNQDTKVEFFTMKRGE